jgi:hypothetical protein
MPHLGRLAQQRVRAEQRVDEPLIAEDQKTDVRVPLKRKRRAGDHN